MVVVVKINDYTNIYKYDAKYFLKNEWWTKIET
jgi:hypothetical protein